MYYMLMKRVCAGNNWQCIETFNTIEAAEAEFNYGIYAYEGYDFKLMECRNLAIHDGDGEEE
jgi:hypothetical protein